VRAGGPLIHRHFNKTLKGERVRGKCQCQPIVQFPMTRVRPRRSSSLEWFDLAVVDAPCPFTFLNWPKLGPKRRWSCPLSELMNSQTVGLLRSGTAFPPVVNLFWHLGAPQGANIWKKVGVKPNKL
jgi:hypothetical protein